MIFQGWNATEIPGGSTRGKVEPFCVFSLGPCHQAPHHTFSELIWSLVNSSSFFLDNINPRDAFKSRYPESVQGWLLSKRVGAGREACALQQRNAAAWRSGLPGVARS